MSMLELTEALLTLVCLIKRSSPPPLEAQAQNIPEHPQSSWLCTLPRGSSATTCLLPQPWSIICEAGWPLFLTFLGQGLGGQYKAPYKG